LLIVLTFTWCANVGFDARLPLMGRNRKAATKLAEQEGEPAMHWTVWVPTTVAVAALVALVTSLS
jgi:hypothetical protein